MAGTIIELMDGQVGLINVFKFDRPQVFLRSHCLHALRGRILNVVLRDCVA